MQDSKNRPLPWIWIVAIIIAAATAFVAGRATKKPWMSASEGSLAAPRAEGDEPEEQGAQTRARASCEAAQKKYRKEIGRLKNRLLAMQMVADSRSKQNCDGYDPNEVGDDSPVSWPENTPDAFREQEFTRIFKDSIAEAGLDAELVDIRCEEAPCMAMLRLGGGPQEKFLGKLTKTQSWLEKYDGIVSLWQTEVDCGGGGTENIAIIGKSFGDWDDKTEFHLSKRITPRMAKLVENWQCRE